MQRPSTCLDVTPSPDSDSHFPDERIRLSQFVPTNIIDTLNTRPLTNVAYCNCNCTVTVPYGPVQRHCERHLDLESNKLRHQAVGTSESMGTILSMCGLATSGDDECDAQLVTFFIVTI